MHMTNPEAALKGLRRSQSKAGLKTHRFKLRGVELLWLKIVKRKLGEPLVFFDAPLDKSNPKGTTQLATKMGDRLKRITKRVGGEIKVQIRTQYLGRGGWRVRGYVTPLRRPSRVAKILLHTGQLSTDWEARHAPRKSAPEGTP